MSHHFTGNVDLNNHRLMIIEGGNGEATDTGVRG